MILGGVIKMITPPKVPASPHEDTSRNPSFLVGGSVGVYADLTAHKHKHIEATANCALALSNVYATRLEGVSPAAGGAAAAAAGFAGGVNLAVVGQREYGAILLRRILGPQPTPSFFATPAAAENRD